MPGIVGLGVALEEAEAQRETYSEHCRALRDRLQTGLLSAIPTVDVNGPLAPLRRLPNNLNISIPGVQAETLLLSLDVLGIAASAGSACTTGNTEPSHVLTAMGLSDEACRSSLRFTVGRSNTEEQIDIAVDAVVEAVRRVRAFTGSQAL